MTKNLYDINNVKLTSKYIINNQFVDESDAGITDYSCLIAVAIEFPSNLPNNYQLGKILLPVFYKYGIDGFSLYVKQINCNDIENVNTIITKYNEIKDNNHFKICTVDAPETIFNEDVKTLTLDLTSLTFENVNNTYKAMFIIENSYRPSLDEQKNLIHIALPVAFIEKESFMLPNLKINMVDKRALNNLIETGIENLMIDALTGTSVFCESIYSVENELVPYSFNYSYLSNNDLSKEIRIQHDFICSTNINILKSENTYEVLKEEVVYLTNYLNRTKYFTLIPREGNVELFNNLGLYVNKVIGYNQVDDTFLYYDYEDNYYIIMDNNKNIEKFKLYGENRLNHHASNDVNEVGYAVGRIVDQASNIYGYATTIYSPLNINIVYNNNNKISEVVFTKEMKKCTFEYTNSSIIVEFLDITNASEQVILKKKILSFNDNGELIKIEDSKRFYYVDLEYYNNKLISIKQYNKNLNGEYIKVFDNSYIYSNHYTKIVNNIFEKYKEICFDNEGKIHYILNDDIEMIKYSYDGFKQKDTFKKLLFPNDEVKNGSFDDDLRYWNYSNVEIITYENENKYAKLNSNSTLYQYLNLKPGHSYLIRGLAKFEQNQNSSFPVVVIEGSYTESEESTNLITFSSVVNLDPNSTNWNSFIGEELVIPKHAKNIVSTLAVYVESIAYIDDLKITLDDNCSNNLVKDASFETYDLSNKPALYSTNLYVNSVNIKCDYESESVLTPYNFKDHAIYLKHISNSQDFDIYQQLDIEGKKGDRYNLSAFVKANTTSTDTSYLYLSFRYGGVPKTCIFNAIPNFDEFQLVSGVFIAEDDYVLEKIGYTFYGINNGILDELELVKDNISRVSEYDDNLNLIKHNNNFNNSLIIYEHNKPVKSISSDGKIIYYEYDDKNNVSSLTDLFGHKSSYLYTDKGQLCKETTSKNNVELLVNEINYNYSSTSPQKEYINEFGKSSYFLYDERYRLKKEEIPYKTTGDTINYRVNEITYNGLSQLLKYLVKDDETNDVLGYNEVKYNNLLPIEMTNTTGIKYQYEYNSLNLPTYVKINNQVIETYTYDDYNRLESKTKNNEIFKYSYNTKHQIENIMYKKTNDEYFTKVVEFKYNRFNQVSLKIDYTENSCLSYKYDQMNRLVEIIDIDKVNSKSYQYDIDGNLEKVTYSNNNSQRIIEYKNQRSSVTIEKAISKKILDFGCDVVLGASPNKGLLGLEEVSNNTFEIINDSYLEVKVTNLAKTDEFMKYDLQSMNIERPDINSLNKTSLSRTYSLWFKPMSTYTTTGFIKLLDENNQEKVKVYLGTDGKIKIGKDNIIYGSTTEVLSLGSWSNITLHTKNNNTVNAYVNNVEIPIYQTVDVDNVRYLLIGDTSPRENDSGSLNNNDDLLKRTMPIRVGLISVDEFEHAETSLTNMYERELYYFIRGTHQKHSITKTQVNNSVYEYKATIDDLGRIAKYEFIKDGTVKHSKTFTYDKTRIIKEKRGNNEINYTYDIAGNILQKNSSDVNVSYVYDALGRVIEEIKPNSLTTYSYNSYNNIERIVKSNSISLDATSTENYIFTYDNNFKDKITNIKKLVGNNTDFEYNISYENLIYPKVIGTNGLEWSKDKLIKYGSYQYEYNANGQRIKKQVGTKTYTYKYDDNKLIKENIKDETQDIDVTLEYIYDVNNNLLGVVTNNYVYYYDKDSTGEIIGIVDESGNYVVKYYYKLFGEVQVEPITVNDITNYNSIMYKGYYYDFETGLALIGQRYYSPELCRFIEPSNVTSLNPASVNGLNLYSYANNNPVNYKQRPVSSSGSVISSSISSISNGGIYSSGSVSSGTIGSSRVNWENGGFQIPIWISSLMSGSDFGTSIAPTLRTIYQYIRYPGVKDLNKLYGLDFVPGKLNTVCSVIGYGLLVIDIGLSAWSNFTNDNLTTKQQWISFGVDTAYILGTFVIGYGVGALVSLIPSVGVFIAPFVSAGVTWFIDWTNDKWGWLDDVKQWFNDL